MAVYIGADLKLGENIERDQQIIKNWNSIVKEDDLTILFGDIAGNNADLNYVGRIISELNGKKKVVDIEKDDAAAQVWKDITGKKVFKINGAVPGQIKNQDHIVLIYVDRIDKDLVKSGEYGAAAKSLTKQKEVFENNILSVSIDDWGLTPIAYMEVPKLIDNMILFEAMKGEEERKIEEV